MAATQHSPVTKCLCAPATAKMEPSALAPTLEGEERRNLQAYQRSARAHLRDLAALGAPGRVAFRETLRPKRPIGRMGRPTHGRRASASESASKAPSRTRTDNSRPMPAEVISVLPMPRRCAPAMRQAALQGGCGESMRHNSARSLPMEATAFGSNASGAYQELGAGKPIAQPPRRGMGCGEVASNTQPERWRSCGDPLFNPIRNNATSKEGMTRRTLARVEQTRSQAEAPLRGSDALCNRSGGVPLSKVVVCRRLATTNTFGHRPPPVRA